MLFRLLLLLFVGPAVVAGAVSPPPEAIAIVIGDLHSAYDRTAQFVARVDRLRAENPGVPVAVFINGDSLEYGNVVARRTGGAVDFALFEALVRRAPVVLNLGNHEADFLDFAATFERLAAAGVTVISANLSSRANGRPFAPPLTRLKLGAHELTIVGLATDNLATFRAAVRPDLDLANPVVWARANFGPLLKGAALPVVLSHAGLRADREMLALAPDGTLFAGAHDHLRFVHRAGRTAYFHSGSWMDFVSIARLQRESGGRLSWEIEQQPLRPGDLADRALGELVRDTLARHLTAEETAVVGRTPQALPPAEAARFAVEAARQAAAAEVALVGGTTFGAGLPAGAVTRSAFDACVRFDGPLFAAEVEGAWLLRLLARCNQTPDTPFAARGGENLVAAVAPELGPIRAGRRYTFVTTDWIAKNPRDYLGENPPALAERPELRLKAAVLRALAPTP